MDLICQGQQIYILILLIDIGFAAFSTVGIPRLENWNNVDGQSQYSQSNNYYIPNNVYSQWGVNSAPQNSQYFQPSFSPNSPPPSSSSFRVPYAAYRNSAFSFPTSTKQQIDNLQKQQLTTIDESENFNSERRKSAYFVEDNRGSEDGIQRILKTVAEKLPKIAETMSKLGHTDNIQITSQVGEEFNNIDKQQIKDTSTILPYFINKREYNSNNELKEQNSFSSSPLFSSFNKLLSAFNSGANNQLISTTTSSIVNLNKENSLLKSEDLSPELIFQQKGVLNKKDQQQIEEKSNYIPHLTPPPEIPSSQNPLNSFLHQFGILMPNEKAEKSSEVREIKKREENGGDFLTNLMKGQLPQMPDLLNQFGFDSLIGGTNNNNNNNNEQQKSGNALASIFGRDYNAKNGGGNAFSTFFGSGLDDTPKNK